MMHTLKSESDLILEILFERVFLGFCMYSSCADSMMIGLLTRIENYARDEHKDYLQKKQEI
jgi:hypothetical protein